MSRAGHPVLLKIGDRLKRKHSVVLKPSSFLLDPTKSNHCLPLSLADSLNKLTDITLAFEDANFKLLDAVRF